MGATQKFGEEKARNGAIALDGHGDLLAGMVMMALLCRIHRVE
jgi:hypothetical protein